MQSVQLSAFFAAEHAIAHLWMAAPFAIAQFSAFRVGAIEQFKR